MSELEPASRRQRRRATTHRALLDAVRGLFAQLRSEAIDALRNRHLSAGQRVLHLDPRVGPAPL